MSHPQAPFLANGRHPSDQLIANHLHCFQMVADNDNGHTAVAQAQDVIDALFLERLIADCQDFIDQQQIGVAMDGHAEARRMYIPEGNV